LVEKMNLYEKGFETILRMTLKSINRHVRVMFSSAPGCCFVFHPTRFHAYEAA